MKKFSNFIKENTGAKEATSQIASGKSGASQSQVNIAKRQEHINKGGQTLPIKSQPQTQTLPATTSEFKEGNLYTYKNKGMKVTALLVKIDGDIYQLKYKNKEGKINGPVGRSKDQLSQPKQCTGKNILKVGNSYIYQNQDGDRSIIELTNLDIQGQDVDENTVQGKPYKNSLKPFGGSTIGINWKSLYQYVDLPVKDSQQTQESDIFSKIKDIAKESSTVRVQSQQVQSQTKQLTQGQQITTPQGIKTQQ